MQRYFFAWKEEATSSSAMAATAAAALTSFLSFSAAATAVAERASCGNLLARVTLELFRRKLGAGNEPIEVRGMALLRSLHRGDSKISLVLLMI